MSPDGYTDEEFQEAQARRAELAATMIDVMEREDVREVMAEVEQTIQKYVAVFSDAGVPAAIIAAGLSSMVGAQMVTSILEKQQDD